MGKVDGIECWEEADARTFMVRGRSYMADRVKVPSAHSLYRCASPAGAATPLACNSAGTVHLPGASRREQRVMHAEGGAAPPCSCRRRSCICKGTSRENQFIPTDLLCRILCHVACLKCVHLFGACPCCRLLGCDIYSFDFKINHISRHIQLPEPPALGPEARALPPGQQLPPLLVLNIQLPTYSVRPPCPFFPTHPRLLHAAAFLWGTLQTRSMLCCGALLKPPMQCLAWCVACMHECRQD